MAKTMLKALPGGRTVEKAIEAMTINEKDDKISFGPLGELSITEMKRYRKYPTLYPWGRRFSTLTLLLMRSKVLSIMRTALELQNVSRREDIPAEVRKILATKAFAIRKEALSTLRNIDERLFNIKYALYDEL